MRACGVLETVRISAVGYPSRLTYQEFCQRFHELINSKQINNQSLKEKCEAILIDLKKYQFGKTKIFFQEGQLAYRNALIRAPWCKLNLPILTPGANRFCAMIFAIFNTMVQILMYIL